MTIFVTWTSLSSTFFSKFDCKTNEMQLATFWNLTIGKLTSWKVLFTKLEMGTLKGDFATSYFPTSYSNLRYKTFQLLHFLTTHTTSSPTANIKYTESEEWIYWSFIFMQKLEWKPWIRHDLGFGVFYSLVLPSSGACC